VVIPVLARDHEDAVASVMDGFGVGGAGGGAGFDGFEDEQAVFRNQARIHHLAFDIRIAFPDERSGDVGCFLRCQAEFGEFVVGVAVAVADADHRIDQREFGDVDDAFAAFADHLEGVIVIGDEAAEARGLEFHHHMPAHGHDIHLSLIGRADEHNGPRLEKAPHLMHGQVALGVVGKRHASRISRAL